MSMTRLVNPYWFATPAGTVITSDSFNRANGTINGVNTDAAAGGTAKAWSTTAVNTQHQVVSNALGRVGTSGAVHSVVDASVTDGICTVTVAALPAITGAQLGIVGRAPSNSITGDRYDLMVGSDGALLLRKSVTSVVTTLATLAAGTVAVGNKLTLELQGQTIRARVNGVIVADVIDSAVTTGTRWGIRSGASSGAWSLDDFLLVAP